MDRAVVEGVPLHEPIEDRGIVTRRDTVERRPEGCERPALRRAASIPVRARRAPHVDRVPRAVDEGEYALRPLDMVGAGDDDEALPRLRHGKIAFGEHGIADRVSRVSLRDDGPSRQAVMRDRVLPHRVGDGNRRIPAIGPAAGHDASAFQIAEGADCNIDAGTRLRVQVASRVHEIREYDDGGVPRPRLRRGGRCAHSPVPEMKVLFLTGNDAVAAPLADWLGMRDEVLVWHERLDSADVAAIRPDLAVGYSYWHVIGLDVLALMPDRFVNLHIALLPFNRGADPNAWSFLEDTPKGVSIHIVDAGVDTGPILVQKEVAFDEGRETLRHSYAVLQDEVRALFRAHWERLREGTIIPVPQVGPGTFHRAGQFRQIKERLLGSEGWDVPVPVFRDRYRRLLESPGSFDSSCHAR
jgi:formyl transferase-like protein